MIRRLMRYEERTTAIPHSANDHESVINFPYEWIMRSVRITQRRDNPLKVKGIRKYKLMGIYFFFIFQC
jgi:hypothetical protein